MDPRVLLIAGIVALGVFVMLDGTWILLGENVGELPLPPLMGFAACALIVVAAVRSGGEEACVQGGRLKVRRFLLMAGLLCCWVLCGVDAVSFILELPGVVKSRGLLEFLDPAWLLILVAALGLLGNREVVRRQN